MYNILLILLIITDIYFTYLLYKIIKNFGDYDG